MTKEKNKKIRVLTTREEGLELIKDGVSSVMKNLQSVNDPTHFLVSTGIDFLGRRINKWSEEIKGFISSGKARKEIDIPYRKLFDTFKFLKDTSISDDDFLEALKHLHILSFSSDIKEEEEFELYVIMDTLRKLNVMEVRIILSSYSIGKNLYDNEKMTSIFHGLDKNPDHEKAWALVISRACGYSNSDYILSNQSHLEELRLISPRAHNVHHVDGRGNEFGRTPCFRLTNAGEKIAEFIIRGEKLSNTK